MSNNPLQKYFRQPKVFIRLPSGGLYTKPGTLTGDVTHMPVYGMTGMDEIMIKTPDALLTGESTANAIASCCPNIKDPWAVSVTDIMLILAAIRISTYGNEMTIAHTCSKCSTENEYQLDLNKTIEHYMSCQYQNTIVLDNMTIKIQPLTYRQSTDFNLRNFKLQQQLNQAFDLEDKDQQSLKFKELYKSIGDLQIDILKETIESVAIDGQVVTERDYIIEWITNCDKTIVDAIKELNQKNNETWTVPRFKAQCENCNSENSIAVELDESSFFARA